MPNLNNLTIQDLQWGIANWSGQGYIDGLKMVWNSATSISVTSGAAFIPSLSKCLPSTTMLTLSGLALAASTWYHLYLYLNAGTPDIEIVTTAPAAPYNGTARAKTGDTSRRYIGSVLTDSSGNLWYFNHAGNKVAWGWGGAGGAPQRPLSGGAATVATTVALGIGIPVTATHATLRISNFDPSVGSRIANSLIPGAAGSSGAGTNFLYAIAASSNAVVDCPVDGSQSVLYWLTSAPTVSLAMDIFGYLYER